MAQQVHCQNYRICFLTLCSKIRQFIYGVLNIAVEMNLGSHTEHSVRLTPGLADHSLTFSITQHYSHN
jgi:hypothetical protein